MTFKHGTAHAVSFALCLLGGTGCAAKHYDYSLFSWAREPGESSRVEIVRGSPGPALTRAASVVDAPKRLLPARMKSPRHTLSETSATLLVEYLQRNDLADVPVFVNHYDPGDQWRRLRENRDVSPAIRYTFGVGSLVRYTLLPNPVFGRNQYNPYTDSLYIETDRAVDVLYAAADAKNLHSRRWPGLYALGTSLPVASLGRGVWATRDVVGYAAAQNEWETERDVYRVLYPRLGAESLALAVPPGPRWWLSPVFKLSGAGVGRGVGYAVEQRREQELGLEDGVEKAAQGETTIEQSSSSRDPPSQATTTRPGSNEVERPPPNCSGD